MTKRTLILVIGSALAYACVGLTGLGLIIGSSLSRQAAEIALATEAPSAPNAIDTTQPTKTPQPTAIPIPTATEKPASTVAPTVAVTDPPAPTETSAPTSTAIPTSTPQPTETSLPPTIAPTHTSLPEPTAMVDEFASGGLGLSRGIWDQSHTLSGTGPGSFLNYDEGKYSLIFTDNHVWHLERNYPASKPTLDEARLVGSLLIPEDSRLVETYSPDGMPELTVDLYISESLKEQLVSDMWIGGEPGNFIIIYGVFDGVVARVVIGTGNNP